MPWCSSVRELIPCQTVALPRVTWREVEAGNVIWKPPESPSSAVTWPSRPATAAFCEAAAGDEDPKALRVNVGVIA